MEINCHSSYIFERKFNGKEVFQVKLTSELLEDFEDLRNSNEVILNIEDKSGTLSIPQKNNLSKVFNLNIEPILKGTKESLEVNIFRSKKLVESIAPLNVRLNVQPTSKIYDMTKKKIVEIEDENKKHCVKELKLPVCANKSSAAYKVIQSNENRKSETNIINPIPKKITVSTVQIKVDPKEVKKAEFTIREKLLHLLAIKLSSKDALLLGLRKLGVTSASRAEVEKHLKQIATINKENLYQLSNQYIFEIREDWPHYDEEGWRKIAKIKADVKAQLRSQQNFVNNKPNSHRNDRQDTISPAESNASSKAMTSADEGFISGDRKSHNISQSTKRRSQHLSTFTNDVPCKKINIHDTNSRNDINSSSSCDVTPKSDVSQSSIGFRVNSNQKVELNSKSKYNSIDLNDTQDKFNVAFEEYAHLCEMVKKREAEIENLRDRCKTAKRSDYMKMYKLAKVLLDEMNTPQFKEMTDKMTTLECKLSEYSRILTDQVSTTC